VLTVPVAIAAQRLSSINRRLCRSIQQDAPTVSSQCADKYIFQNPNITQAGHNLSKLLECCCFRRTYASGIDGKKIGSEFPPIFRRFVITSFSKKQFQQHEKAAEYPKRKLMITLPDGSLAWNAKHFRTLILLSAWLGFKHLLDVNYAHALPEWKAKENLLYEWLKIIHEAGSAKGEPYFEMPPYDDHKEQIRIVCQAAPKVRAFLAIAHDAIKYKRKVCVWTLVPTEQLLVWDILRKLKVDARLYSSDMSSNERADLVDKFNESPDEVQFLITSFSLASCGMDLQNLCHETVNFDLPLSRAQREQTDHRSAGLARTQTR